MKKILNNKLLLLLIITIFLLLFSLGTNTLFKTITINEQKELIAPANWYEDYTYVITTWPTGITLQKYNGSESEVYVPSTATIDGRTYNVNITGALFENNTNVTKIEFEAGIKAVGTMENMFYNCTNLQEIIFNNLNTAQVTNLTSTFQNCSSIKKLDLSSFNTSSVLAIVNTFANMTSLEELDISSWDTRNATDGFGLYYGAKNLKKFKIGPNTNFHIYGDSVLGFPLTRGTLVREEDGMEFKAVDMFIMTDHQDMSGTYVKISDINTDMMTGELATYRIGKIYNFNEVTSDVVPIEVVDNRLFISNIPTPTTSDYRLDNTIVTTFENAVIDETGTAYDLKMTIDNIWLYDFNELPTPYVSLELLRLDGNIKVVSYLYEGTDYSKTYEKRDVKYDITLEILDKDGNPVIGDYIFSAYDIDVPSVRGATESSSIVYGEYSEGLNLLEGFIGEIKVHPQTFLRINRNRITGSRSDAETELSEFIVRANANRTKFSWTGAGCGTVFFGYYQPRVVEIEKQDNQGNVLPGAELEIYKADETTPFRTWTSTNSPEIIFVNPGEYIVKETNAPTGYTKSSDIDFYADIEDKLTINGENVDKVIVKNTPNIYSYTILYVDKDTNNTITEFSSTAPYNSTILASEHTREITNYTFDHWDKESIVMSTDNNVIKMYYARKKANIFVKYVDQDGNYFSPTDNINETKEWGKTYSYPPKTFSYYDYVESSGDDYEGTVSEYNYEIIHRYKIKTGTVITHHYLYDGTETTTELAPDVTNTYNYTTTYNTSISNEVPVNYELYRKTNNYTGVITSPSIEVIYYYQLKDSSLSSSINKTGPEKVTSKSETVNYTITYNVEISDYIGSANITITDTLPYHIDTSKSNLDGGTYNSNKKEITWTIPISEINSYEGTNQKYKTTITKNIAVVYSDLNPNERNMINNVVGKIVLDNKQRETTNQISTSIQIPGKITIKYVDENNKEIADPKETTGLIGSDYYSEPIEIKGYVIKQKPDNEHLIFTEDDQEIVYVYEKAKVNIKTRVEGNGGTIKGDESIYYGDDSTKDTIIIEANEGFVIEEVTVNNIKQDIKPNQERLVLDNFIDVTEDKEVVVKFKPKETQNPNTNSLLSPKKLIVLIILLTAMTMILEKFPIRKKVYRA